MEARIVPAGPAALPAIAALARIIWQAHYPGIISQAQIDYMLAKMYALEVLEDELQHGIGYDQLLVGDELAGFASHSPVDAHELKLHKLYVHPRWQRHGFGTMLLHHVECAGKKRGFATLTLAVNKRNTTALSAYRKNGFQVRDSVVVDIGAGFVMDDYVLAKGL